MIRIVRGIALFFFTLFIANEILAQNATRAVIEGVTGTRSLGAVDALIPFLNRHDAIFYSDIQAKAGSDEAWFAGVGLGYRQLLANQVFGGYLFLDRNNSEHHKTFWILSPGFEILRPIWDFRVNGYIPVSDKQKVRESFFLSGPNSCGQNGDPQFIEFHGHQQFEHRFSNFEEVGPGVDLEVGLGLPHNHNFMFHAGGYYFHLEEAKDVKGVGGRLEFPVNNYILATARASYDNDQHGAIVAGLQFQLGNNTPNPVVNLLYKPVVRNLSTIARGSSVPIIEGKKDDGLFLTLDNIFFFQGSGGTAFDGTLNSGTFENPLSADAFNQATLLGISTLVPTANFYLSPGTYIVSQLQIFEGQSVFGRSPDFRLSAVGSQRPLIEGEIDLFEGNNTLDSIQILNEVVDGPATTVIALNIEDAINVEVCNAAITASSLRTGDNSALNAAIGVKFNNSAFTIHNSVVQASAQTVGDNNVDNIAVAIGSIDADPVNSQVEITNASINSSAITGGDNLGNNVGIGIGNYLGQFENNRFSLIGTSIDVTSSVNNNLGKHIAVGIGTNSGLFNSNNFEILNLFLDSIASVADTNSSDSFALGIGAIQNSFIENVFSISESSVESFVFVDTNAGQMGSNGIGAINSTGTSVSFLRNEFTIFRSVVTANASVNVNNGVQIFLGVGSLDFDGSAQFNENIFSVNKSAFIAQSTTTENNGVDMTVGLGNFQGTFNDNRFDITESVIIGDTDIINDNNGSNETLAVDVSGLGTLVNIARSFVSASSIVGGNNLANSAIGLRALGGATIVIRDSRGRVEALVNGTDVTNTATPTVGNVIVINTPFTVIEDP